jgi:PKHD-type hydroxylase
MQIQNNYFIIENAVTNRFCDHVLQYGKILKENIATVAGVDEHEKEKLEKSRKSNVVWLDEKWIYREIQPLIREVNMAAKWNFKWTHTEVCQFTKYMGSKKQYYDWHTDSGIEPQPSGLIRKISASLALVDKEEYQGGDFQICQPNPNGSKISTIQLVKKASMIFFPSFIWHRVTPVTEGTRYSLVCWNQGPKFV